jgi:hypothetical protein
VNYFYYFHLVKKDSERTKVDLNKFENQTNEDKSFELTPKRFMSYRIPNGGIFQESYPWGDFQKILTNFKENNKKTKTN